MVEDILFDLFFSNSDFDPKFQGFWHWKFDPITMLILVTIYEMIWKHLIVCEPKYIWIQSWI